MATAASTDRPHLRAPWPTVLRAQVVLLLRAGRPWLLLALVVVIWAVYAFQSSRAADSLTIDFLISAGWLGAMFAIGVAWGTQLWNDEGPADRWYHWSLPVDTTVHACARLVAGAVWLLAGVALFLVLAALIGVSTDAIGAAANAPPLVWLNLATAALLGYLLGAALSTITSRALELSLIAAFTLALTVTELGELEYASAFVAFVNRVLGATLFGQYGLLAAVAGMGARGTRLEVLRVRELPPPTDPAVWLGAIGLWFGVGLAAFLLATAWLRRR